mgnify:CR=1 FL=1|tara:strand:+ start:4715 stop:4834 length:120 start_codon:yes stop_codon:yes gene_type:complete
MTKDEKILQEIIFKLNSISKQIKHLSEVLLQLLRSSRNE